MAPLSLFASSSHPFNLPCQGLLALLSVIQSPSQLSGWVSAKLGKSVLLVPLVARLSMLELPESCVIMLPNKNGFHSW